MISSSRGRRTTDPPPPRDPTWGPPVAGPVLAPQGGRNKPGGSLPSQPPIVPHPLLPTAPPVPQPLPLPVLTRPRQDEDLFICQALLPGELGEPLQALGTELLRPACSQEQGERQPPHCTPQ